MACWVFEIKCAELIIRLQGYSKAVRFNVVSGKRRLKFILMILQSFKYFEMNNRSVHYNIFTVENIKRNI